MTLYIFGNPNCSRKKEAMCLLFQTAKVDKSFCLCSLERFLKQIAVCYNVRFVNIFDSFICRHFKYYVSIPNTNPSYAKGLHEIYVSCLSLPIKTSRSVWVGLKISNIY